MRGSGLADGFSGQEASHRALPAQQLACGTAAEALAALGSGPQGIDAGEARQRLKEFGPNRIEAVAREPRWLGLLREFSHFFAIVLWLAAALAFVAERYQPGQGMAELGYAIVGVILLNGGFSFWQTYRAEQA